MVWELRKVIFLLAGTILKPGFCSGLLHFWSSLLHFFFWSPVVLSLIWSALTPGHDSCFRKGHRNYLPELSWQNSASLRAACLLLLYVRTALDFRITWRINPEIWGWGDCALALQMLFCTPSHGFVFMGLCFARQTALPEYKLPKNTLRFFTVQTIKDKNINYIKEVRI